MYRRQSAFPKYTRYELANKIGTLLFLKDTLFSHFFFDFNIYLHIDRTYQKASCHTSKSTNLVFSAWRRATLDSKESGLIVSGSW